MSQSAIKIIFLSVAILLSVANFSNIQNRKLPLHTLHKSTNCVGLDVYFLWSVIILDNKKFGDRGCEFKIDNANFMAKDSKSYNFMLRKISSSDPFYIGFLRFDSVESFIDEAPQLNNYAGSNQMYINNRNVSIVYLSNKDGKNGYAYAPTTQEGANSYMFVFHITDNTHENELLVKTISSIRWLQ